MPTLYFIPGLGADYRLFSKQKKAGFKFQVLEWIRPKKGETLQQYSLRLSEGIHDKSDFVLLGVSLGGLVAQEIAKVYPPKKLILISSAKCTAEIPFYLRILRILPLHRLFPGSLLRAMGRRARLILGGIPGEDSKDILEMVAAADPVFIEWGIDQVIHWNCKTSLKDIVHFHGTSDIVFPACWIKNAILVKGGTHIMILAQAEKVNKLIRDALEGTE